MTRKRHRFTADFKKQVALEALRERDTVQAIAARHEVHPNQVSAWKRQAVEGLEEVFSQPGSKRGGEHEATIRELHAKIGELRLHLGRPRGLPRRVGAADKRGSRGGAHGLAPITLSWECACASDRDLPFP